MLFTKNIPEIQRQKIVERERMEKDMMKRVTKES